MNMSFAYHSPMDEQSKRTIQLVEVLLRSCVLDHFGDQDEVFPLVEFIYNNSYHVMIGMTLYDDLYGRRCKTPLCWYQEGETILVGLELLQQATKKFSRFESE